MNKGRKTAATFMLMLFVVAVITSFLPKVAATPTPMIDFLEPSSGIVGAEILINGTIDTPNGTYEIRWDGNPIETGKCEPGSNVVNDSFIVPESVWGPHNVTLYDVNSTETSPTFVFTVETAYYIEAVVPSPPEQLQEGQTTVIWVNITGGKENTRYWTNITVTEPPPSGKIYFNDTLQLTNTTNTGYGVGSIIYYTDFSLGAHTNYTGTYRIALNETLATENFTVGLTDKLEYYATETMQIRGSGYQANENVTINIEFGGESVGGYPKINVTADEKGVVTDSVLIPLGAEPGIYTVTITNATTPGTVKEPADTQNFTITGVIVQIQTRNLDDEPVANVPVQVYNVTRPDRAITFERTNETGWVRFPLEAGNYTFRALWREEVVVGSLTNESVMENIVLNMTCRLAHIKIAVKDEATLPNPLPFINVTLAYNYITYYNVPGSKIESFETNASGITIVSNMLTNISYTIEARRFGHLFNRTLIENLTASRWVNITCPTYTLFVHVLDAKKLPIHNVQVAVYEWSTWTLVQPPKATNQSGSTDFFITFGRYKVSVSNYSAQLKRMIVINETVIDLVKENQWMLIHCKLFNLDLSVKVVDYFGQPVPNALVEIEREGAKIEGDLLTKSNGIAFLNNTIGGDYQISVRIRGRLLGTKSLYLDESKEIVFKIDGYVVIGGYPLETSQLITLISMSLLVVILGFMLAYRKLPLIMGRKKPSEKVD